MTVSAVATPIIHECHVCEPRGGCLGIQLIDREETCRQLAQTRRIAGRPFTGSEHSKR